MRVDDVASNVCCGPSAGSAPETPSSQGSGSDPRPTDRPRRAKQQVPPGGCCLPRRLTHFEPSYVESSGAL